MTCDALAGNIEERLELRVEVGDGVLGVVLPSTHGYLRGETDSSRAGYGLDLSVLIFVWYM